MPEAASFLCIINVTKFDSMESLAPISNGSPPTPTLFCVCMVWVTRGLFGAAWEITYHPVATISMIAPDLRGHGDSGKPPTGYAFQDYQADINALLDHLNLDTVDMVAHSWGAKLACRWLTTNPDRVKRVVLTDPFFIGTIPAVFKLTFPLLYRVLSFLKLSQPFSSYAEAEALAQTLPEFKGWSTYQQILFAHAIEEKADGTWSSKFSQTARDEVFEEVMSVPGLTDSLAMPCLLLKPDKGVNRSDWQIAPFRQYFSQLTLESVAGNHWSFLVNAAEFNPRVAAFLRPII